ncbi:MAG: alkaline phosphatase, partial [Bacteroidota bacterium]|nr:alkaline phosphatase [Bacteroidota bacterium]
MKFLFLFSFTLQQLFVIAQSEKPKNIILMIGDGMGLSQISMAYYFQKDKTNFDRFFDIGLIITSSKSHKITDSAAGATAFSTGKKTYNGAIGLDADSNTVPNIVEIINKEKQMSAGLVATSSITHATPACFYAHQKNRNMEYEIASDLIKSPVVYFAGGGKKFFRPIQKQLADQFLLDTTELQIKHLKSDKRYGFILAENGMPKWSESRGDFLIKATQLGMDRLSLDTNGFFLMVESSQIDWGGHANDPDFILSELIDFD